jgi:hypothetical protein
MSDCRIFPANAESARTAIAVSMAPLLPDMVFAPVKGERMSIDVRRMKKRRTLDFKLPRRFLCLSY